MKYIFSLSLMLSIVCSMNLLEASEPEQSLPEQSLNKEARLLILRKEKDLPSPILKYDHVFIPREDGKSVGFFRLPNNLDGRKDSSLPLIYGYTGPVIYGYTGKPTWQEIQLFAREISCALGQKLQLALNDEAIQDLGL